MTNPDVSPEHEIAESAPADEETTDRDRVASQDEDDDEQAAAAEADAGTDVGAELTP